MSDDTDSRTAAFSRKRAAGDDGAVNGAPSKRPKSPIYPGSFSGWNNGVRTNIRPSLGRPRLSARSNAPTAGDKLEAVGLPARRSASPSTQFQLPEEPSEAAKSHARLEPVYNPAPAAAGSDESSSEEGEIQSAFSGDDEAVVINVAGADADNHNSDDEDGEHNDGNGSEHSESSLESGEISDDQQPPATGLDGADDDESQDMDVSDDDDSGPRYNPRPRGQSNADNRAIEVIDLDDDDGSSMARTTLKGKAPVQKRRTRVPGPPVTLADLDFEELQKQLRYYHIGQDPAQIPLTELARCLSCATIGHIAAQCPELECENCGAVEEHFTAHCPKVVRCNRCQKRGHGSQSCPLKLMPTEEELQCDLCGCSHHGPLDCETLWRTSHFPPANALGEGVRLYCYECGTAGHLGNDCSKRRPGKACGTSMWSERTMPAGAVPASTRDHNRGPIPLSKTQLKKRERMGPPLDHGHPPIATNQKSSKPKNAPIRIGGNIGQGRADLQGAPKRPAVQQPPAPVPGSKPGRRPSKKKGGNSAVRPMPGAAKKAYQKGKS